MSKYSSLRLPVRISCETLTNRFARSSAVVIRFSFPNALFRSGLLTGKVHFLPGFYSAGNTQKSYLLLEEGRNILRRRSIR